MTVGEILEEPLIVHGIGDRVGTSRARVNQFASDWSGWQRIIRNDIRTSFSGGQRQRIGIATPRLAVGGRHWWCATNRSSALDVSIQAQGGETC